MNDIIWLSHGGPGSGRYPKGSGKKHLKSNHKSRKSPIEKFVSVGAETAVKIGNTKPYQKIIIPTANKVSASKPIDGAIKFVDKVGSRPISHMRKNKGFNHLYKAYFNGVKYISMKTGMSENAVRIALM